MVTDDGRIITPEIRMEAEAEFYAEKNNCSIEKARECISTSYDQIIFDRMVRFHMGEADDVIKVGEIMKSKAISYDEYMRMKKKVN